MLYSEKDDGVEDEGDKQGDGQGFIPLIANNTFNMLQMLNRKIDDGYKNDVEANDDQCTYW